MAAVTGKPAPEEEWFQFPFPSQSPSTSTSTLQPSPRSKIKRLFTRSISSASTPTSPFAGRSFLPHSQSLPQTPVPGRKQSQSNEKGKGKSSPRIVGVGIKPMNSDSALDLTISTQSATAHGANRERSELIPLSLPVPTRTERPKGKRRGSRTAGRIFEGGVDSLKELDIQDKVQNVSISPYGRKESIDSTISSTPTTTTSSTVSTPRTSSSELLSATINRPPSMLPSEYPAHFLPVLTLSQPSNPRPMLIRFETGDISLKPLPDSPLTPNLIQNFPDPPLLWYLGEFDANKEEVVVNEHGGIDPRKDLVFCLEELVLDEDDHDSKTDLVEFRNSW